MSKADVKTVQDRIDPARAEALSATLGVPQSFASGASLPPFAHHAYFWEAEQEGNLSEDGHSAATQFSDPALPVRMWAGGRLRFHTPFRAAVNADRITRVAGLTRKEGKSGKLAFVTLRHEIRQRGQPVLTEDQDIVYRAPGVLESDAPTVMDPPDERRPLKLSNITLFRYSALTFNAHRIHYDAAYCAREGYPGIVVHGPLMATLLAGMAAEQGALSEFSYKATAPLFLGDVAWLCRTGKRYWVEGPRRRLCMTATVG